MSDNKKTPVGQVCWRDLTVEVIDGPRPMGKSRFCVIRDPAGTVAALISTTE